MMNDVGKLFLTPVLSDASRTLLATWAKGCQTGKAMLRAGLPADWTIGDKTGNGYHGETNDIAIAWRPHGAPLLMAVYYAGSPGYSSPPGPFTPHDAVIAAVGRIVAKRFS